MKVILFMAYSTPKTLPTALGTEVIKPKSCTTRLKNVKIVLSRRATIPFMNLFTKSCTQKALTDSTLDLDITGLTLINMRLATTSRHMRLIATLPSPHTLTSTTRSSICTLHMLLLKRLDTVLSLPMSIVSSLSLLSAKSR